MTFDDDGWFIEHSYVCRLMGTMGSCDYNTAIRRLPEHELAGRFMIAFDNDGDIVLIATGSAMSVTIPRPDARQDYPFPYLPVMSNDVDRRAVAQWERMCDELNLLRSIVKLESEPRGEA